MLNQGEVLLLTDRCDRYYFSKKDVAEGYLIIGDKKAYFTDFRYLSDAKRYFRNTDVNVFLYEGIESIKAYLTERGVNKAYINYGKSTVREFETFKGIGLIVLDANEIINKEREVKTEKEILLIKKACKIAQRAFYKVIKQLKVGVTELEIKEKVERYMVEYGADEPAFETIVAFGKGSAVPHHVTSKKKLTLNQPVLIDMGARYKGYVSDLTRTVFFGTPEKKFIKAYDLVLRANLLAEEKIKKGYSTDDCDRLVREYFKGENVEEYFTHSLGHGVGLEVHEFPTLSIKKSSKLKENSTFTIEPGLYYDGKFGIRIEDTVVMKNGKIERLFTDEKKLLILK